MHSISDPPANRTTSLLATQPRTLAPFAFSTLLQTFVKELKQFAATSLDFGVRTIKLKLLIE